MHNHYVVKIIFNCGGMQGTFPGKIPCLCYVIAWAQSLRIANNYNSTRATRKLMGVACGRPTVIADLTTNTNNLPA